MASKTEQILTAMTDRLRAVPKAKIERNTAAPERIPKGGLIVLRDGDPGEPEEALGGIGSVYYAHAVEIEVHVEAGEASARRASVWRGWRRRRRNGRSRGSPSTGSLISRTTASARASTRRSSSTRSRPATSLPGPGSRTTRR